MLDMNMRYLQVCWEGTKTACFILVVCFCLQGRCSWPKNSTAFELVQLVPRPILKWRPKEVRRTPSQSGSAKVDRACCWSTLAQNFLLAKLVTTSWQESQLYIHGWFLN